MKVTNKTRDHIIQQAALLFNQRGIAGTTIDDILLVTRVAKGSLYKNFPDKESLAYASVDYLFDEMTKKAMAGIQAAETAYLKVTAVIDIYQNSINSPFKGGCPILNFGVESDDTDPVVKGKVKEMLANSIMLVQKVIEEGVRKKQFSKSIDPKVFAIKMFAILEGGTMMARTMNDNKSMTTLIKMLKDDLKTYLTNS